MSRRKQSNPKPLKSETHEHLPVEYGKEADARIGEDEEWASDADTMTTDETAVPNTNNQIDQPPESATHEKTEPDDVTTPKLRLKAHLATDPALQSILTIPKLDSSPEYLATIQTALATRNILIPTVPLPENVRPDSADIARQPLFVCTPCGIRFSSISTLEAHQTYYCSHRVSKPASETEEVKSANGTDHNSNQSDQDENPSKIQKTGKQYTCTHCSYSADKKVSLNRHMRMHTVSPGPVTVNTTVSNGDIPENHDRYCAECDIRFSSQKTYRAHKMHYCSSRHMVKSTPAPSSTKSCTSGSTPASPVDNTCRTPPSPTTTATTQQQPFLALPTNPIIIVPYSLFKSASVLPGLLPGTNIPAPDTPCFLLPNGTLQPMTQAMNHTPKTPKSKETVILRENSAPLDLSIRKSPDINHLEEKETKNTSPSLEKSEPTPSQRGSPPLTPTQCSGVSPSLSSSPKRKLEAETSRSSSPRLSRLTPKSNLEAEPSQTSPEINTPFGIPALNPFLLRAGSLSLLPPELQLRLAAGELPTMPPAAPQVLVKQGVSKCKECNIVFCKHENYIIHKKHYCSARIQDDDSKHSTSPPTSPGNPTSSSPATGQYQQLICVACGIKFTSLDNLNAHQAYYCLKRADLEVTRRCAKCRGPAEPGHQCGSVATPGWKCPCCDVVSATASAAQRHMETHSGVKAYRCTICKYKGNTLRGMRTHIRMHFDKRSPDLQEEKYISYILEDEGATVTEVSVAPISGVIAGVTDDRPVSPVSEAPADSLHHCTQCLYSSAYKANVLRHMKLMHPENASNSQHQENGKEEEEVEEEEEIVVKKEAIEPEVIIAHVEETIKEERLEQEAEILQEAAKPGPKYCKSCDISFTYYSTFVAHKKYYCSSHAGEITAANNNNNTRAAAEASVL